MAYSITIRSQGAGYSVVKGRNIITGKTCYLIKDGEEPLFVAQRRTMEDFLDEVENGGNECAHIVEVFETIKGNRFIYWRDEESGEDFITRIEKPEKKTLYTVHVYGLNQDGEETEIDAFSFTNYREAVDAVADVYENELYSGIDGLWANIKMREAHK